MKKRILWVLLLIISIYSDNKSLNLNSTDLVTLRLSLKPFIPNVSSVVSPITENFLNYYKLNSSAKFSMGYIDTEKFRLAAYLYTPKDAVGTVLIIHGYLDNSGVLSRLQQFILNKKYAVLMIDLPGHGLSSGKRGDIEQFDDYSVVIDSAVSYYKSYKLPGKLNIIAHSTGCAIALNKLKDDKNWNGKTLFLAPLVRSELWSISHFGYELIKSFTKSTPRLFRKSSHDKDFLNFLKEEPLVISSFPLSWGNAVYEWNKTISKYQFKDEKIVIIQGTEDETLDWKYNLKFFKKRFKSVEIYKIDGAYHHLANEAEPYRSQVYGIIDDFLNY